jgi:hypothetical protein
LFAFTVNVYAVPAVNPETVTGDDEPVPVILPGLDVTVNEVAAAPAAAGVNETVAVEPFTTVAVPIVGTRG